MFAIITILAILGLWLVLAFRRFLRQRELAAKAAGPAVQAAVEPTKETFGARIDAFVRWLPGSVSRAVGKPVVGHWTAKVKTWRVWRLPFLEKWLLLVLYATFLYLAASGFFFAIFVRRGLYGVPLLVHFTAGIVFALCLMLVAVIKARRFAPNPSPLALPAAGDAKTLVADLRKRPLLIVRTSDVSLALFWVFVAAGLSLAVSALLPMLPWFHYQGQQILFGWHRWSALVSFLAAVGFADLKFFAADKA